MLNKISVESTRLFDLLRGVAALLVVLGHSREHAAKIFSLNPTGKSLFEKIFLIPSSFAMESVAVFFVLSGFFITYLLLKDKEYEPRLIALSKELKSEEIRYLKSKLKE